MKGPRLSLRAVEPDDLDTLHTLWNDPELHLLAYDEPYVPMSTGNARHRIEQKTTGQVDRNGDVLFVAVSESTSDIVGITQVSGISSYNQLAQLGIAMLPSARGQGYGLEALTLTVQYGFRLRGLRRLELGTRSDNAAMRAIAEKAGFTYEGMFRQRSYNGEGHSDVAIYGLLRHEWHP